MQFAQSKRYICPKCTLTNEEKEILKRIHPNSQIISWISFSGALSRIIADSYIIETKSFSNSKCQPNFNYGHGPNERHPFIQIDYLHKDGLLIRYYDESEQNKFSLFYALEIYGKDNDSIENLAREAGLSKNLEALVT